MIANKNRIYNRISSWFSLRLWECSRRKVESIPKILKLYLNHLVIILCLRLLPFSINNQRSFQFYPVLVSPCPLVIIDSFTLLIPIKYYKSRYIYKMKLMRVNQGKFS